MIYFLYVDYISRFIEKNPNGQTRKKLFLIFRFLIFGNKIMSVYLVFVLHIYFRILILCKFVDFYYYMI